jgi:hypothetical protein
MPRLAGRCNNLDNSMAPHQYSIHLTKCATGRFTLKIGGHGNGIKGDIKKLQEIVQAASLLLAAAASQEAKTTAPGL